MPKIFAILLIPLSLLFILKATSFAYNLTYEDFYDWGPWYYKGESRVLAETTSSAQIKPSSMPSAQATVNQTTPAENVELTPPTGLLPDSPVYFLKPLGENIRLAFIFGNKDKERFRLGLAEERLAETKVLLEKEKYKEASKNFERYKQILQTISKNLWHYKQKDLTVEDLAKEVELISAKHSLVLEKTSLNLPPETEFQAEQALKSTQKAMDVSSDVLGRDPLPADLKERLESLRALGILRQGEIAAIFVLKYRDQVREEVERLAKQNLFPEADVKRLDEAQLGYFPNDYLQVSEIKKLNEFKKLEDLKPDDTTLQKIAEFASKYKPGETIPPDLRKWWVPLQRYDELQATLRPDVVATVLANQEVKDRDSFQELLERFKSTEDELKSVEKWVQDNPGKIPPPEVQRVAAIAMNFGSQVKWTPSEELKKIINAGTPTSATLPAGFNSITDCQAKGDCQKICDKNPLTCSTVSKTSLASSPNVEQKQMSVNEEIRLDKPLSQSQTVQTLSPTPASGSPTSPDSLASAGTKEETKIEPLLKPEVPTLIRPESENKTIFPKGYSTPQTETSPQTPQTTGEPVKIETPVVTPIPMPETEEPASQPETSSNIATSPNPQSGGPTPTPLAPLVNVPLPTPLTPPTQSIPESPPPAITPPPAVTTPPTPNCPTTSTRARNSFTGEITTFPTTCLPASWYPYIGPDHQEVYTKYKFLFRRYFQPNYRRSFNR